MRRILVTLTIDPARFGAFRVGSALWPDGRETTLWSEPTADQFSIAVEAMSGELDRMMKRLNAMARRRGLDRFGYFRVVELHRNLWPHYHLVLEHPVLESSDLQRALSSWSLGIVDARDVSLDDAVGEVAPYLVSSETKGKGHKAYQFAAPALPKGFRLYSASRGFLVEPVVDEAQTREPPEHAVVLRGHFTGYHKQVQAWGGESRLVLPVPAQPDRPHRPPASAVSSGDVAMVLYAQLVDQATLHATPEWLRRFQDPAFWSGELCREGHKLGE